jgi:hypothetical protein
MHIFLDCILYILFYLFWKDRGPVSPDSAHFNPLIRGHSRDLRPPMHCWRLFSRNWRHWPSNDVKPPPFNGRERRPAMYSSSILFGFIIFLLIYFFSYFIQHCFICRPSDSTVPTDAWIEPRTVATSALAATWLDLIRKLARSHRLYLGCSLYVAMMHNCIMQWCINVHSDKH